MKRIFPLLIILMVVGCFAFSATLYAYPNPSTEMVNFGGTDFWQASIHSPPDALLMQNTTTMTERTSYPANTKNMPTEYTFATGIYFNTAGRTLSLNRADGQVIQANAAQWIFDGSLNVNFDKTNSAHARAPSSISEDQKVMTTNTAANAWYANVGFTSIDTDFAYTANSTRMFDVRQSGDPPILNATVTDRTIQDAGNGEDKIPKHDAEMGNEFAVAGEKDSPNPYA